MHPPLSDILQGLRRRTLRSSQLVDQLLDRLEASDRRLRLTLLRRDAEVRAEAAAADDRLDRGTPTGPLEGLPVTFKDTLDTAGIRTSSGSLRRMSRIPDRDAVTVGRWRRAGALVLAKSNTPEFAFSPDTRNKIIGRTRNPWRPGHTTGGSSGGEAALIASSCSLLGLGSDLGGSLRLPAHFCGVAALKPTVGALPNQGHPPVIPPFMQPLAVIGPLARDCRDLAIGWAALIEDSALIEALIEQPEESLQVDPVPIRVVFAGDRRLSPACRSALERAEAAIGSLGCRIERCEVPAIEAADRLWEQTMVCDGGKALREMVEDGRPFHLYLELIKSLAGLSPHHVDLLLALVVARSWRGPSEAELMETRANMLTGLEPLLADRGVLLLPAAPAEAFPAWNRRPVFQGLFRYVRAANVYGLPALSVPVVRGAPGRLPVGIQLVGGPGQELEMIRLGAGLERALERDARRDA